MKEMKEIEIKPVSRVDAAVKIPGSKSYTQRALAIAALAEGTSFLSNALFSGDTERLMSALRDLGANILVGDDGITVTGTGGNILNPDREIHLGNNGTALRLLISLVALGRGNYVLTGDNRLCERPVKPLLDALASMGVRARSDGGFPPVTIDAEGLPGGTVALRDIESSQYVSSLLISAPYAAKDTTVELRGRTPSQPYIDMTLETMEAFGVPVAREAPGRYGVKAGRHYRGRRYRVEGDASSASYFFLAAAVSGGRVRVEEVNPRTLQGDIAFLGILEQLGCAVLRGNRLVEVKGGILRAGDFVFDLGDMPDMVPTLAVLGAVRPGKTVVKNVSHLRFKESNRLEALVTELNRVGIRADETEDGLVIEGGNPRGAAIETYNDHRIAMSFAVLGLVVPGMRIKDGDCVKKSFPGFWAELSKLTSYS
ncbi:MAG TPA: 3-phosphoshikimate 1-carboxyvinyltransferase [Syntrophales bacterium]|nr:3-phosphoshikimate 1-carboxyvinyltransferase [Syntrophobacterales bacterium]HRT70388.1 3-phosphoshikimate 1-carboxyvinyltransferase [Syntrophales bacterium]